jgi:hypothetical protein
MKKNGQRRYKYLVLGRDRSYFVKHHSDSTKKFSETHALVDADYRALISHITPLDPQNKQTFEKV